MTEKKLTKKQLIHRLEGKTLTMASGVQRTIKDGCFRDEYGVMHLTEYHISQLRAFLKQLD